MNLSSGIVIVAARRLQFDIFDVFVFISKIISMSIVIVFSLKYACL